MFYMYFQLICFGHLVSAEIKIISNINIMNYEIVSYFSHYVTYFGVVIMIISLKSDTK